MLNHFEPALPVQAMKTYSISAPQRTHWRPATCAEVDCPNHLHGWRVRVEGLPPELLHTAKTSGRRYEVLDVTEGETWLVFEPGQVCFQASQHKLPTGRPELYVVRGGDWRGNPTGERRIHTRPELWVEDFGEHQQRLAEQIERG